MLDTTQIVNKINSKLDGIGINSEVSGEPSHTANLVSLIVSEIITAIKRDAQVNTTVNTSGVSSAPGSPEVHTGYGSGRII